MIPIPIRIPNFISYISHCIPYHPLTPTPLAVYSPYPILPIPFIQTSIQPIPPASHPHILRECGMSFWLCELINPEVATPHAPPSADCLPLFPYFSPSSSLLFFLFLLLESSIRGSMLESTNPPGGIHVAVVVGNDDGDAFASSYLLTRYLSLDVFRTGVRT